LSVANTAKGCSEPQAKQVEHGGRVIADEILACTPMLLISKSDRIVARDNQRPLGIRPQQRVSG
jgi:hypothetical protein